MVTIQPKTEDRPAVGRRSRSDGERTRAAITAAAVELIAEQGLAATTQRKVAQRAGVSLASVTYHFATVDDLLESAFNQMIDDSVARLNQVRQAAEGGAISLDEAWESVVRDPDGRTPAHVTGSFELLVAAMRQPELRPIVRRLLSALSTFFETWTSGRDPAHGALSLMLGLSLTEAASGRRLENDDLTQILIDFGLKLDRGRC